jgi:alpha-L-fucosidase
VRKRLSKNELPHSKRREHQPSVLQAIYASNEGKFNAKEIKKIIILVICMVMVSFVFPQKKESITSEWNKMHQSKRLALKDFNNAKFGMFIHWGVYSQPAGIWKGEKIKGLGEWIMYHAQIPREEYKNMCRSFNPVKFNAEEWVKAAKMAGMKYIVAMPKHHDGFAMYNSKVTDYDIIDATPFGRDPMAELYNACQKYGIKFSIYYSQATDWMDGGDAGVADYLGSHPEKKKKSQSDSWQTWPSNTWDSAPVSFTEYLEKKSKPQMKELLQKFPNMQEVWYDVPQRMTQKQSFEFYKLVYDIQPSCLINSRVGNDFGDFWIPGDNKIPEGEEVKEIYWETPGTLNNTWGYKSYDVDWKSTEELLFWITEITSKGGNYLLNVGPTAEGIFPKKSIEQLKTIGEWMAINGESVYGTKKWKISHEGPTNLSMKSTDDREENGFNKDFSPEDFWFSAKDNVLYVTALKWPENKKNLIKSLASTPTTNLLKVESVKMLGSDKKVLWGMKNEGLLVSLPSWKPNQYGYVLKIVFEK